MEYFMLEAISENLSKLCSALISDCSLRLQQTHPTGPEYDSEGPGGFWACFHTAHQCGELTSDCWGSLASAGILIMRNLCWYQSYQSFAVNLETFVSGFAASDPALPLTSSVSQQTTEKYTFFSEDCSGSVKLIFSSFSEWEKSDYEIQRLAEIGEF